MAERRNTRSRIGANARAISGMPPCGGSLAEVVLGYLQPALRALDCGELIETEDTTDWIERVATSKRNVGSYNCTLSLWADVMSFAVTDPSSRGR